MDNNFYEKNETNNNMFSSSYSDKGIGQGRGQYNDYGYVESDIYSAVNDDSKVQSIITKAYIYMVVALIISAGAAYFAYSTDVVLEMIYSGFNFYGLVLIELGVVFAATKAMQKQITALAASLYVIYSLINGFTLAYIFVFYEMGSIVSIFGFTALLFTVLAFIGMTTDRDLTSLGTMGLALLIVVIVMSLLNIFFIKSESFNIVLTIVGLALFVGITMYDAQKMKVIARTATNPTSAALYCALNLYLDFVNLFIRLLSLFGKRK